MQEMLEKDNPEVLGVRPLLEGMVGFSSPFKSLKTIMWYFKEWFPILQVSDSAFSSLLTFIKKLPRQGIEHGPAGWEADALSDDLLRLGWYEKYFLFI